MSSQHGHSPLLLCWSFRSLAGGLAVQGHCCVPPPCTLTLFSCSLVFSSAGHFLGHLLESSFGTRPTPSGSALRRSPCFREMLLWRLALSQKCPLPVPACGKRTPMQQDCDQDARALRPYTSTRAEKKRVEMESKQLRKDQALVLPGSAAVQGHFSPPPLHTGTAPVAPEKVSREGFQASHCNVLCFV